MYDWVPMWGWLVCTVAQEYSIKKHSTNRFAQNNRSFHGEYMHDPFFKPTNTKPFQHETWLTHIVHIQLRYRVRIKLRNLLSECLVGVHDQFPQTWRILSCGRMQNQVTYQKAAPVVLLKKDPRAMQTLCSECGNNVPWDGRKLAVSHMYTRPNRNGFSYVLRWSTLVEDASRGAT